mmetsp:Transcript_12104/g.20278  ORF Transcript_12104/g.20278 Transcript_12104/m.20278 type:complete len:105 (+) Transcript_12104:61-375(+)
MFKRSNTILFRSSNVLNGLGNVKKARQGRVARRRALDAQRVKEKRRELIEQGAVMDPLVARAYAELKEEGWVSPEEKAAQQQQRQQQPQQQQQQQQQLQEIILL